MISILISISKDCLFRTFKTDSWGDQDKDKDKVADR